jgi:hypothetical protein
MPLSFESSRLDNAHLLAEPVEHTRTVELISERPSARIGLVQLPQPALTLGPSTVPLGRWQTGFRDQEPRHFLRLRCLRRNGGSVSVAVRSRGGLARAVCSYTNYLTLPVTHD